MKNIIFVMMEENRDISTRSDEIRIARNINKYHRFLHGEIQKYEGKVEQKTAYYFNI